MVQSPDIIRIWAIFETKAQVQLRDRWITIYLLNKQLIKNWRSKE